VQLVVNISYRYRIIKTEQFYGMTHDHSL